MRWRGSYGVISCRISCHLFLWLLAVGKGREVSVGHAQNFKICSRFSKSGADIVPKARTHGMILYDDTSCRTGWS
jgi:hypothetical protein